MSSLRKPWLSPAKGQVGVRDAAPGHRFEEPLALHGRADHVVQPLEQQEGHADPVAVVDRRALPVAVGHLVERPDQRLQVLRLEVVGLAAGPGPAEEVEDRVDDRAAGVGVGGGEGGRAGPAARAAAADGEPVRVGGAFGDQPFGDGRAVLDVDHAPLLAQPVAVGAAVAGGAAVVDLGDADAARGEVGDLQVEHHGGAAGGAAVHPHHVRGGAVHGGGRVARRVDVGVHLAPAGPGEGAVHGVGDVGGVDGVVVGAADDAGAAGRGVEFDDLVRGAGARRRRRSTRLPVTASAGFHSVHGPGRVGDLAGGGVEHAEPGGADAVQDGDQAVVQRVEPAVPDLPQRARELLLAAGTGRPPRR